MDENLEAQLLSNFRANNRKGSHKTIYQLSVLSLQSTFISGKEIYLSANRFILFTVACVETGFPGCGCCTSGIHDWCREMQQFWSRQNKCHTLRKILDQSMETCFLIV
jgi:hypothetical protein